MKQNLKKIYTILTLVKNLILRKSKHKLHFIAKTNKQGHKYWYYDFKWWGFNQEYLLMVAGADQLCEYYANKQNQVTVQVYCSNKPNPKLKTTHDELIAEILPHNTKLLDKYLWGRTYNITPNQNNGNNIKQMWICPVTLFVLGKYPKYLYVKKL